MSGANKNHSSTAQAELTPTHTDDHFVVGDVTSYVARPEKAFSLWSTLGIAFSITSTPLAIGTYLSVAIGVGGSPVSWFGYIMTILFNMCVCLSLAEMASIMPHSSGRSSTFIMNITSEVNISSQVKYIGHRN